MRRVRRPCLKLSLRTSHAFNKRLCFESKPMLAYHSRARGLPEAADNPSYIDSVPKTRDGPTAFATRDSLQSYIRHLEWARGGPCRPSSGSGGICVTDAPIAASGKRVVANAAGGSVIPRDFRWSSVSIDVGNRLGAMMGISLIARRESFVHHFFLVTGFASSHDGICISRRRAR